VSRLREFVQVVRLAWEQLETRTRRCASKASTTVRSAAGQPWAGASWPAANPDPARRMGPQMMRLAARSATAGSVHGDQRLLAERIDRT